jgi:steroid delta-isomerase-like uncharacterized protein
MTASADVVGAHYDILNRGHFDAWIDLLAPDLVAHHVSAGDIASRDAFIGAIRTYRNSFPDLSVELHRVIADGSMAAAQFTSRATFVHDYFGIPATGKPWELPGMGFYRIEGGRLSEMWWVEDVTGWMQRLAG